MKERHKITPASYILLKKGNEILMHKRQNSGYMDGYYSFVAGHIEACEGSAECIIREAEEEAGIKMKKEDMRLAHVLYRPIPSGERIDFFYICEKWEGEIINCEKEKCSDLRFFPMDNLPENTIPYLKSVIEKISKNEHFSEYLIDDHLNIKNKQ